MQGSVYGRLSSYPLRACRKLLHYSFRLYNQVRLRNKNFSVICNDCTGGVIVSTLHVRFDSPTVNLWLNGSDFLKFCRDLKYYISSDMIEDTSSGMDYPVGILGSGDRAIRLYFLHYDTFTNAKEKWETRKARMHWDNLYFIMNNMNDREGKNEELAREFDALPYEHKAFITLKEFEGVRCSVRLEYKGQAKNVLDFPSEIAARRIIDHWDYVSFLNS